MAERGHRAAARRQGRFRSGWVLVLVLLLVMAGGLLLDRAGLLPQEARSVLSEIEREAFGTRIFATRPRPRDGRVPVSAPAADAVVDYEAVEADLARIRVEPEARRGYSREDWPHWLDEDGDCLNAREEVLERESLEPVRRTPDGCGIESGLWRDAYTGEMLRDPRGIDVDHVVALQEAHDSGGHRWERSRRAAYANDLSDPLTLRAVGAAVNRAKGAKGPEEWLPPNAGFRCRYLAEWIHIKARWDLAMDESERVAAGNILADCRSGQVAERPR